MTDYVPRLLRVNLTLGAVQEEAVPSRVVESFVGGRGFGAWYLYDELRPGTEPLGPENKLILLAGPLAGTNAQSVSRWRAVTRSPLTETYYRSVGGGNFGAWLRFAGYHLLILEGRAQRPTYLHIDDQGAHLRDASSLWGLTTSEAQSRLKETHGRNTRTICIGPAGLVRFAGIFSDRRCAGRGGTGATQETTSYLGLYPTANFRYGRLEDNATASPFALPPSPWSGGAAPGRWWLAPRPCWATTIRPGAGRSGGCPPVRSSGSWG